MKNLKKSPCYHERKQTARDAIKHMLILMFLYYAGLRLSELINLKWQDILHPKLKEAIEEYGIKNYGFVLKSDRGKKYSPKTIQEIVKKASKRQELTRG